MKKLAITLVAVLLALSIALNVKLFLGAQDQPWFISFDDTNTRETYETVHNVKAAQKIATGKGIKVGILDKYFGYANHPDLYAGGMDFVGDTDAFEQIAEHGHWMATTLREIAPDCEVYALGARSGDRALEAETIVNAIDWAIENDIDILTYSARIFGPEARPQIDAAVSKAHEHGIVTTFIHYPHPGNILPYGLFSKRGDYDRAPDLSICHFDYNVLMLFMYERFVQNDRKATSGDNTPFFSFSSMSPVTAGFVAILKEINPDLSPDEYRQILVNTSREYEYRGHQIPNVVDIAAAVGHLQASQ